MIHVGIAACWSDLPVAQRLVEDLASADIAARLICAGAAADEDGVCDVVVALWSPAAFTSLWVRRAAADAAERGRLVEACLTADPSPLALGEAAARYRNTSACAQRIAERARRCAQGRPQGPALAKAAGPLVAAAALAAAAAAPFLVEAFENNSLAKAANPSPTDAMAEAALPPPSPRNAPREPSPAGNGQGGPLIENDR